MNKSLKKKWIKALRSGEYVQGRYRLVTPCKDYDKFCCLGVICDVMGVEFEERSDGVLIIADTTIAAELPDPLRKKADLNFGEQEALMKLNDFYRWNFNKIADWIDENL